MYIQRFSNDQRGAIAIMCALVLLPVLLGSIGLSLDFARAYNVESRLNAIADATALSVARQRSLDPGLAKAKLKANGAKFFEQMAAAEKIPVSIKKLNINPTSKNGKSKAVVKYVARVQMAFGGIFGKKNWKISGEAVAEISGHNLDVHIVLDVSDSMALGASASDQQTLANQLGCVFACHVLDGGPEPSLVTAQNLGIPMRIDVLKAAAKSVIDRIAAASQGSQVRIAIYALHHETTLTQPLTTNIATAKAAIDNLDIGLGLPRNGTPEQPGDTVASSLPATLGPAVGKQGSGAANDPRKLVILATDGTASTRDPYLTTKAFDPSACTPLKKKGIDIGVIYTTYDYWGKETDATYPWSVKPIEDQIEPNMKACASPGLFAKGDEPAEITAAFHAVWSQFEIGMLRLTH